MSDSVDLREAFSDSFVYSQILHTVFLKQLSKIRNRLETSPAVTAVAASHFSRARTVSGMRRTCLRYLPSTSETDLHLDHLCQLAHSFFT